MIFDSFRARVGVAVISKGKILLVRDTRTLTFHLPGDVVRLNETLWAAAKRAVKEQAGLDVELQKLLYVRDGMSEGKHRLDLFFLGKIKDVQEPAKGRLKTDWVSLGILESMDLFPKFLRSRIAKDYKSKFGNAGVYVGPQE